MTPAASPIRQLDTKNARDPHQLPAFNNQLAFHEPLLYLPPLLSSLPEQYTEVVDPQFPRVVTETRLPNIDPASLSLHKALHAFRPVTLGYATVPYHEAFNWSELKMPLHDERECLEATTSHSMPPTGWHMKKRFAMVD